jgi:DNA-binding response OmpR family regulator
MRPGPQPGKPAPTVLVVDDDELTTAHFARMLSLDGYDVRGALSAETALTEVSTHPPDAIILDLRMPLMDGLGFLQRLRAAGVATPVTIVTGDYFIDDAIRRDLRALGAEIRFKPLWLEELTDLVQSMLKQTPRAISQLD